MPISDAPQIYHHLITHVVPGPASPTYFLPFFILPAALLIPPSRFSHLQLCSLFLPLIYGCQIYYLLCHGTFDTLFGDLALRSFALLADSDPRSTFRRIRFHNSSQRRGSYQNGSGVTPRSVHQDSTKETASSGGPVQYWEEPYPAKLADRVGWVFSLVLSLRFTHWKTGNPSHDKTQPPTTLGRSHWTRHAIATIVQSYLIMDVASYFVQFDPYFITSNIHLDSPIQPLSDKSTPNAVHALQTWIPPRLFRLSLLGAQVYSAVTLMFFLPTLPALGLNALHLISDEWSPHTWPVFWGPLATVSERGVRGLWGGWWHQIMRNLTTSPARSLERLLNVRHSSLLDYTFLTVSAFFFSGILHMGLVPPEPIHSTLSPNTLRLSLAAFFWAQIPAFAIETAVSKLWPSRVSRGETLRPLVKVVLVIWTITWLYLTLPLLAVPFKELGYWKVYPVPVSLLGGLTGNGWVPWLSFAVI
ncbi:MAG: hypothetical protein M1837_004200 [Sclerophora amabilis]|nr:MAG: hypothetical protein M1837_004200 [Sclerophora amabilis]